MARVTANPQKKPAPRSPGLKEPLPVGPATAHALKLSPRKTRTNVPIISAKYFLVQLSATAIDTLLQLNDRVRFTAYPLASPPLRSKLKIPHLHAPAGAH